MPIYLDINKDTLDSLSKSQNNNLCLRYSEFNILGVMEVNDIWERDKKKKVI